MSEYITISHNGVDYKVHAITDAVRDAYEAWMKGHVLRELDSLKEHFNPGEYREVRAGLIRDIASGVYAFGGEAYQQIVNTPAGGLQLLRVLLRGNYSDEALSDLVSNRSDDINAALEALHPQVKGADDPAPKG